MRLHLECCTQLWGPQYQKTWICWSGSEESQRVIREMEYLLYNKGWEMAFFSLEKRRSGKALLKSFLYRAYRKDGNRLFSRECSDRTRVNAFTLKINLDYIWGDFFFTMWVLKHWNEFYKKVVDSPFLETCRVRLKRDLSKLVKVVPALCRGMD